MSIKTIVKNNPIILGLYQSIGSLLLRIASKLVRTDDKTILFVSYGGRHYNDSPKYIYEYMRHDSRFGGYHLVWAFVRPEDFPEIEDKVRIDSLDYYKTALRARCWITNVIIERGLNFKGKNCFYFHTTHVTLPKLTGYDAKDAVSVAKHFRYRFDMSCAQSEYEKELQYSMYGLKPSQVLVCGYPKNDRLVNVGKEEVENLREKIGIPAGKKAILYAPTFRGNIDADAACEIDFKKWESILGEDYVVLFRAHPVLAGKLDLSKFAPFVINVTPYPDNVDLMMAADVLISDYSGIFFEFGVQDKPMYCFAYDYEEYTKEWKLYMDLREELPGGKYSEEELLHLIKAGRTAEMAEKLQSFRNKYIAAYGSATKQAVDTIYNNINK